MIAHTQLTKFDKKLAVGLASVFSVENMLVVLDLLELAPHAGEYTTRLTTAAYRKGLLAGLSFDAADKNYPRCPYDHLGTLSNFGRGKNSARNAWRDGSKDGIRVRDIVFCNQKQIPPLRWSEYKVLTPTQQAFHDNSESGVR